MQKKWHLNEVASVNKLDHGVLGFFESMKILEVLHHDITIDREYKNMID